MGKESLFTSGAERAEYPHARKWTWTPTTHLTQKWIQFESYT